MKCIIYAKGNKAASTVQQITACENMAHGSRMEVVEVFTDSSTSSIDMGAISSRLFLEANPDVKLVVHTSLGIPSSERVRVVKGKGRHAPIREKAIQEGRKYCRSAPYGYSWTPEGGIKQNPAEFLAIAEIKDMRKRGMTTTAIAQEMNDQAEYRPRLGKNWSQSTIYHILQRESAL